MSDLQGEGHVKATKAIVYKAMYTTPPALNSKATASTQPMSFARQIKHVYHHQSSFPVSHKVGNIVNFVLDLNVFKFNIKLFTVTDLLEFSYIFCIYIFLDICGKFT